MLRSNFDKVFGEKSMPKAKLGSGKRPKSLTKQLTKKDGLMKTKKKKKIKKLAY